MGITGNPVYSTEVRTINDGADANALTFNEPVIDLADRTAANKEAVDSRVHEFIKPYDVLTLTAGRVAIVNDFVAESPPLTKDLGLVNHGYLRALTGDGQFLFAAEGNDVVVLLPTDLTRLFEVPLGVPANGVAGNGFKWACVGAADGNGDTTHIYSHALVEEAVHSHGATLHDCDIDNTTVYVGGEAGTGGFEVRALAIVDGSETWAFDHGATVYGVSCDGTHVHIVGDAGTGGATYRKLKASDGVEVTNYSLLAGDGRAVVHGGSGRVWMVSETGASTGNVVELYVAGAPMIEWQTELDKAPKSIHWDGTDIYIGCGQYLGSGKLYRLAPSRGRVKGELVWFGNVSSVWSDAHRLYAGGELFDSLGTEKLCTFHLDGQSRRYHRLTGGGGHVLPYRGLVVPEVR